MRKNWISILLVVFLGISGIKIVKASAQSGLSLHVAPRLWLADWSDKSDDGMDDSTLMYGITGVVAYNKFGIGMSILTGDFTSELDEMTLPIKRSDTDIYLSYKLLEPYLILSVGYKIFNYELKLKGTFYDSYYGYYNIDEKVDVDIAGFGLGLSGGFPIAHGFNGYYIVSYLPSLEADFETSVVSWTEDLSSFNIEVGGGYAINERIRASLGYKYQQFDWEESVNDTVSGPTFTVNFSF